MELRALFLVSFALSVLGLPPCWPLDDYVEGRPLDASPSKNGTLQAQYGSDDGCCSLGPLHKNCPTLVTATSITVHSEVGVSSKQLAPAEVTVSAVHAKTKLVEKCVTVRRDIDTLKRKPRQFEPLANVGADDGIIVTLTTKKPEQEFEYGGRFSGTYTATFTRTGNVFVFLYMLDQLQICMLRQLLIKAGPPIHFPAGNCVKLNFNGVQTTFFNVCAVQINNLGYPAAAVAIASDVQVLHMDVIEPRHSSSEIEVSDQFDNSCNNELPPFHSVRGTMSLYEDPAIGSFVVSLSAGFEVCEGRDCSTVLSTYVFLHLE